jgi:SAM-dependent methyltransferase
MRVRIMHGLHVALLGRVERSILVAVMVARDEIEQVATLRSRRGCMRVGVEDRRSIFWNEYAALMNHSDQQHRYQCAREGDEEVVLVEHEGEAAANDRTRSAVEHGLGRPHVLIAGHGDARTHTEHDAQSSECTKCDEQIREVVDAVHELDPSRQIARIRWDRQRSYLSCMITDVLIPARHHLLTRRDAQALLNVLASTGTDMQGESLDVSPDARVHFVVLSYDHDRTRRNPFPGYVRMAALVAWYAQAGLLERSSLWPVPDTGRGRIDRFASYVLAHVEQTLDPASTLVVSRTPDILRAFAQSSMRLHAMGMGSGLWPMPAPTTSDDPAASAWEVVERLASGDDRARELVEPSALSMLEAHGMPERLRAIFADPMATSGELTTGRDYNVYSRAFDEGARRKWEMIETHVEPGVIVDLGCGPGSLLAMAAQTERLHESDLHGVEVSRTLYAEAQHRRAMGAFANPHTFMHHANVLEAGLFAPRSVHTTVTVSLTHEIRSYGSDQELQELLRSIHRQSAPGGVYVNFDLCGPPQPDQIVRLRFKDAPREGVDALTAPVRNLNVAERWLRFCQDWTGPADAISPQADGSLLVSMRRAWEFALHKDYTDNWASEMQEQYGGWNYERWQDELIAAGFSIESASHAFTNQWLVDHRFGDIELSDPASGQPLPWPTTHCLLVARAS